MHQRSLTVQISAAGDDPPTGFVLAGDEPPAPFAGWLELMQTIQRLAATASSSLPAGASEPELLVSREGV
jgi:hypothetical protein